ncbi:MAG: acetyltransferase [Proteobacteria bacterium]|nr:acetyltransferase [Pseudomonadota bacterium]
MKQISKFIRIYSGIDLIRVIYSFLTTRVFFSKSRLIRQPFYIRGKKYINLGNGLTTGVGCRLDAFPMNKTLCIEIGNNVEINDYVHIGAIKSVKIGNNVLIASKVFITDHNHGSYGNNNRHDTPDLPPKERELSFAPVLIEDNVWIGEFVSILPGVTIGKGSIIGTMSVVTKNIPPYSIAVGSPARVVKKFNFETKKWEKF